MQPFKLFFTLYFYCVYDKKNLALFLEILVGHTMKKKW